jgi:hypothetical protein
MRPGICLLLAILFSVSVFAQEKKSVEAVRISEPVTTGPQQAMRNITFLTMRVYFRMLLAMAETTTRITMLLPWIWISAGFLLPVPK